MVVLVYLTYPKYLDSDLDSLSPAGNFCRLLITFVNSLDLDQAQQNVGSGSKLFDTLIVSLKVIFENVILRKISRHRKNHVKLPSMQFNSLQDLF